MSSKGVHARGFTIAKTVTINKSKRKHITLFHSAKEDTMGGYPSKSEETVKAESFQQESLRDNSMSLVNLHMPSSVGGAMRILVILGLGCLWYGAARLKDWQKEAGRRAASLLEIAEQCPA